MAIKKSDFTAQTTVVDSDTFDFVRTTENFKISFANLKTSMGITVSLASVGSPLGNPTMFSETSTSYKFRAIESGSGIKAQLSALNGIEIGLNLTQDAAGVVIFDDVGAVKPTVASLVAGSGINISKSGDAIQITAVIAPISSKTITVSSLSDLPAPSGGVITLVTDINYLFLQDISTPDRFVVGANNTISAAASQIVKLTYTGSGVMFTGNNNSLKIDGITLSQTNASGSLFAFTNTTATGVFQMIESNIEECATIGSFNNMFITRIYATGWEDIKTDGMTFTGTHLNLDLDTSVLFLNGGTFIYLGTATFNAIAITRQAFQLTSTGSKFLDGAANSANITSVGLGAVSDCRTLGLVTPLTGISTDDARWNFILNDEISDTRPDSLLSMQSNTTNTVIAVAGTAVIVAGTWVMERTSQMTGTTAGRSTYNGGKDAVLPVTAAVTVAPVSGGSIEISAEIAINGVVAAGSKRFATAASGGLAAITIPWQINFSTNDYVEVFVTNEDSTVDLLVSSATLRVN